MSTRTMRPGDYEAHLEARLRSLRERGRAQRRRASRWARGWIRVPAALLGIGLLALFAASMALAIHDNPFFELDGNTVNDAVAGADWNDVYTDVVTNGGSTNTSGALIQDFQDDSAQPDSSHHEPSNKDDQPLGDWGCVVKDNVSNKDDIRHAYAAAYESGDDLLVFFGADRDTNEGSANIAAWFFQNPVGCTSPGDFSGQKTDGDLFVVSEFSNGGNISEINVYVWTDPDGDPTTGDECLGDGVDCSTAHEGQDHPAASGTDCQGPDPDAASPYVCATVNGDGDGKNDADDIIDVPWEPAGTVEGSEFFEGGLNLSVLFPELDCFTAVMIETRSSFEFNANLFDYVFLNFDTCGSITVEKQTDPAADPTTFDFNLSPDPNAEGTQSLADGDSFTWSGLDDGSYTLDEVIPAGWDLTDVTCDDDDAYTPDLATGSVTLTLDPLEDITCVYTDQADSNIIVEKVTDPTGSLQTFEFDTDYGSNFFLADGGSNDSGDIDPGTYSVDEINIPAGWNLTDATCDDGSDPLAIDLAAGETVTCTFTNTQQGNIIVEKVTDPTGSLQTFEFDTDYGSNFFLADGGSNDSGGLDPGTYAVAEINIPSDWDLTDATCDDGSLPSAIDLAAGETVTCTFTNTQDGRVEIVKTVSGAPPANGETFDFELRTGASPTEEGTTVASTTTDPVTGEADFGGQTFDPGVYQFCEVGMLPGWHSTLSDDPGAFVPNSDDPGVDNSVVCVEFTLDPGETVTFTIDNTPPPGGDARTIGFWKNWTSCDGHGSQDPVLDDTLASFAGGGILVGDIFVDTCEEAVAILNKSSLDSTKRASDAAYALAAQLLAAELNYQAGAIQCSDASDAIADGQALLDLINFDATGSYLGPKVKGAAAIQRQEALALAATLDDYNNNLLC
jgi:hypothetical protein